MEKFKTTEVGGEKIYMVNLGMLDKWLTDNNLSNYSTEVGIFLYCKINNIPYNNNGEDFNISWGGLSNLLDVYSRLWYKEFKSWDGAQGGS